MSGLTITIDSKSFKSYMQAFKVSVSNLSAPLQDFSRQYEAKVKSNWQSGLDYRGKAFAPLAPSTLLQKRTSTILIETGEMINSLYYDVKKLELKFGIRDPKYIYHHEGTSRMPQRRVLSDDLTEGRELLVDILRKYFKRIKARRSQ
jgi:hypothetical protein